MVRCSKCDSIGVIPTSWTSENPGRRFYCCSKRGSNHGFIDWYYEETCQCSVQVMKQLEDEVAAIHAQKRRIKMIFYEFCVQCYLYWLLSDKKVNTIVGNWLEKRWRFACREGCTLAEEGATGLRGGVGLTNVCDWLVVGAEGVTEACEAYEWFLDGLAALAEAEACEACGPL
ncbi:hypothetical protein Tco_1485129 [Tanacetum coccineum]